MPGLFPFSRGTLVLDLIAAGLFLVLPVLFYSVWKARTHKNYETHRKLQTTLSTLLLVLVLLFELELRIFGWRDNAMISPYYDSLLPAVLRVHLVFSISTTFLWAATFVMAFRRFSRPAFPGKHSLVHKWMGWATVIGTCLTTLTGWFFYYLAFIA